jgi:hypothetical protein
MHAGKLEDGEVVLHLAIISGDPRFAPRMLPDITLSSMCCYESQKWVS